MFRKTVRLWFRVWLWWKLLPEQPSLQIALILLLSSWVLIFVRNVLLWLDKDENDNDEKEKKHLNLECIKIPAIINFDWIERKSLHSQNNQDKQNLQEVLEALVCQEALRCPNKQKFSCQTHSHYIVYRQRHILCEDFLGEDRHYVLLYLLSRS